MCPQAAAIGARGSPGPWPAGRCPPSAQTRFFSWRRSSSLAALEGRGEAGRGAASRAGTRREAAGMRDTGKRERAEAAPRLNRRVRDGPAPHTLPAPPTHPSPTPSPKGARPSGGVPATMATPNSLPLAAWSVISWTCGGRGGAVGARRVAVVRGREEGVLAAGCRRRRFEAPPERQEGHEATWGGHTTPIQAPGPGQ